MCVTGRDVCVTGRDVCVTGRDVCVTGRDMAHWRCCTVISVPLSFSQITCCMIQFRKY